MNPMSNNGGNSISPYYSSVANTSHTGTRMMFPSNQAGSYSHRVDIHGGTVNHHEANTGFTGISRPFSYHVGGNQFFFHQPGYYNVTIQHRQVAGVLPGSSQNEPVNGVMNDAGKAKKRVRFHSPVVAVVSYFPTSPTSQPSTSPAK